MSENIKNRLNNPTLYYPSELADPSANYPFMLFQIQKYPVTLEFTILDDGKSTARGLTDTVTNIVKQLPEATTNAIQRNGVTSPTRNGRPVNPEVVATIALPITNNITNAIGIGWQMESMPILQGLLDLAGGIRDVNADTSLSGMNATVGEYVENAAARLTGWGGQGNNFALKASTAATSELLKRTANRIANPKMQALFNGVQERTFTFEYIFTPISEEEANKVEQIIKTFTMYSLPNVTDDFLIMEFPHEYQISFHGVKGFPILDSCVCTGIATNYTPNTLQLLRDGHAVQIVFALSFMETTLKVQGRAGV